MDDLDNVSKALLEYETLSGAEVNAILRGESIDRSDEPDETPGGKRSSVPASGKPAADKGPPPGGLEPQPEG